MELQNGIMYQNLRLDHTISRPLHPTLFLFHTHHSGILNSALQNDHWTDAVSGPEMSQDLTLTLTLTSFSTGTQFLDLRTKRI